jgi:hypothetical protein
VVNHALTVSPLALAAPIWLNCRKATPNKQLAVTMTKAIFDQNFLFLKRDIFILLMNICKLCCFAYWQA